MRAGSRIAIANADWLRRTLKLPPAIRKKATPIDGRVRQLANDLVLKDIRLPVKLDSEQQPLLFQLYNQELTKRLQERRLLLPNFDKAGAVCIFSDYGGESSDSRYLTYTFTFVDYDFLTLNYREAIKEIREEHGLQNPYKEIAFKDLSYGPIQRALPSYLEMLDKSVNGLVFTLLVDKKVLSLLGENKKQTLELAAEQMRELGFGRLRPKTVEKLQRILLTLSYFTHLLVPTGKKIFWMTDHDSIVANSETAQQTSQMYSNAIHSFLNVKYDPVGFVTPFDKGTDEMFADLLSVSDLVAGAVEHYFTRKSTMTDLTVSQGANQILMWLARQAVVLKKLCIMVFVDDSGFRVGTVDFHLVNPPDHINEIEIYFP